LKNIGIEFDYNSYKSFVSITLFEIAENIEEKKKISTRKIYGKNNIINFVFIFYHSF
jgi:hypothetical protein